MKKGNNVFFLVGLIFSLIGAVFTIVGVSIGAAFYINGGTITVNGVPQYYPPGTMGAGTILFLALFGGIGLLFLVMGIVFIVVASQRGKAIEKLKNGNVYITARISAVERNRQVTINKRHPYNIICEYEDVYSGKIHVFKSDMIMENPGDIVGQDITVYVDSNKWDLYYVDTEALTARYTYH